MQGILFLFYSTWCAWRGTLRVLFFDTTDQRKNEQQLKQIGKEEKREELENHF